ncbi:TPA: hypothetical protein JG819_004691 [Vibrio parahaemolyticus]|nr:hypothetical protein [Vibrio parahaemolyticus]HAV1545591.1 hypothetical protein [Vibrio parahaemolyticus]
MTKKIDLDALHAIGDDAPVHEVPRTHHEPQPPKYSKKELALDANWAKFFNDHIKGQPGPDGRIFNTYTSLCREAIYEKLVKHGYKG